MWRSNLVIGLMLLESIIFGAQIPENFSENDIQYDIEPPQDIRVQCNTNEILVYVDTVNNIFNGMIYPMGLSKNSSCMTEFRQNYGPVKYRLPLRSCNTMSTQLENGAIEYFNTIVVQPHRKLVTNKGRGFHVRCRYKPREDIISNKFNFSTTEGSSTLFSMKMPVVSMKIYNADSSNVIVAENVKIGDPLSIVISINDTENEYGLYITDCLVQDGLGWSEQHLIDGYGCPMDPEIMGQFKYNDKLTKAVVHFQAHKFPYTASVYYQCSVHLCIHKNDGCKHVPPTCNQAESKRRNRREDGNKSQDDGSEAMIEVYSGLYVNEATDIHKPEQMDQVMEKALDDPYSICVSQRSFAVGIAIAGLVLMLLTVIAILIILTRKRTPRKDISTTGSSIYSGPYTNTAYSHTS
ncbi:hypothetical protein PGB90_008712 [Kerria lacca]